jgi:hypothetical protein
LPVYKQKIDLTEKEYREMKKQYIPDREIAKKCLVSFSTFNRWKAENNIRAGRDVSEYIKLRKEGYRDHQIHKLWNITPSALYQWKKPKNLVGVDFNDA